MSHGVHAKDWVKAQKLVQIGALNLGFNLNKTIVVPSEVLIKTIPEEHDSIEKKREHLKVWVK
eukprot:2595576-Prymnesium_polylepis.1